MESPISLAVLSGVNHFLLVISNPSDVLPHFSVHGMCSVCFSLCIHKIIMMKVVTVTEKAMGNPTLLHQVIFSVKVVPHENISNSSNTGRSALPDMYAHARGRVHTYQGNA